MALAAFLSQLEAEISDPEEETFFLFAQDMPSQNLGFIDAKAQSIDVTVNDREFTIYQSPSILSSTRAGGTTGAVLWKITPLFSSWLSGPTNPLLAHGILDPASSHVLELGCGISPLNALALSPQVARYTLTDQSYVQKLIHQNITENVRQGRANPRAGGKATVHSSRAQHGRALQVSNLKQHDAVNIDFKTLDWEADQVTPGLTGSAGVESFDMVVACDCVYNYALVDPFVQTCADACRLRTKQRHAGASGESRGGEHGPLLPCICIVAQQLRSDEVFDSWLKVFYEHFRVWRVPDSMLRDGLKSTDGFVVHVGLLREEAWQ